MKPAPVSRGAPGNRCPWPVVLGALALLLVPILLFGQEEATQQAPQRDQRTQAAEPSDKKKAADNPSDKPNDAQPADQGGDKGKAKSEEEKDDEDEAGKDEKHEKEAKGVKPEQNPIADFFKRALPGRPPRPGKPAIQVPEKKAETAAPSSKSPRSSIDPRAPSEKRSEDWMRKALAQIKAGEWEQALELLQKISELPEDTLYRNDASRWVSIHDEAQRLRGEAPPEYIKQYRVQFGGLARQLLVDAVRSGDPTALGRVARTYFHTEAGYEAANRLGTLHLDRGEFALAAHWFAALWNARAPVTRDPLWQTKAAYVLKQVGQADLSREILEASGGRSVASVGGRSYEPDKWLAGAATVAGSAEEVLSDWPLFYGTPRRTGVAAGGEPLLLPRWSVPTTDSHPVRMQIEHLVEDLSDQGTTALPILFPTMVGGKVAFRTLHGVQVVDAETGRLLWQTDELQPLEKMIAGAPDDQAEGIVAGMAMMGRPMMRPWNNAIMYGGGGDNTPLCNLLFRNANFGLISSDTRQLFVVDDPEFLTYRQPGNPYAVGWDNGASQTAAGASKLTAYNLESGHPLWEIGGPANGEPFDLPLAGYFFFGAPVADGDDLFVVGESTAGETAGQIRLLCLDPRSGAVKWSQLVAGSDPGIEKDVGRRWWTAQVAIGDGILVCPSTVGWLVAVDRSTHSILWGHRSPVQGPRQSIDNEAARMVQYAPLGAVWGPAPPVVAQGRIIYTPSETQTLVCLDQSSGKELWSKPRGHAFYLSGVFEKLVVIVGRDAITAYRLESGEQAWTTKIGAPSGRGVTVADRFYLPLAGGEVWSINLTNGSVANKWSLPAHLGSIGNLAMYRGMLLSVDAFGLTTFEQRSAIQDEIARRKQQDPGDPWALLHEAEISLLERDLPAALAALRRIRRDEVPSELQEPYRRQLADALSATIRADLSRPETDADLRELGSIVRTPDEEQALRRLRAELFVARKDFESAFDAYLALADSPAVLVTRDDFPSIRVRSELWVAGKLADLREALPEAQRESIDRRIAALRTAARGSDAESLRFLTLFRGHPESVGVRRELADKYADRGDFLPAERLLSQLARSEGRAAAEATERLARLMVAFHLPADAGYYYRQLETRFAEVRLASGLTGAEHVRTLRQSGNFPDAPPPVLDWHSDSVRVERMGAVYSNYVPQELAPRGSRVPFFSEHRFEIEHSAQRLEVIDGLTDELYWSLPLRSKAGTAEGGFALASASGHHLTLLHRGVLHSLSPVDRKVLWTRPLDNRHGAQNIFGRTQMPLQPMQQAAPMMKNWQATLQTMPGAPSSLGLSTEEFIGYQGRRSATLLDALSGETCWTYTGVRPGTLMFGGEEVVYLKPPEGQPVALRASDGKRLEVKNLGEILSRAVHAIGDRFILANSSGGKTNLRLHDPLRERDLWTLELPKGTVVSMLDGERMAALETSGKFSVIDLETGGKRLLATLAADELKGRSEVHALADNVSVYLIISKGANQNYYSEQVPFVRANGFVMAFDPVAGRQRWKQSVHAQNLMLERLTFSPYLVFSSRRYEAKGKLHYWSLHLLAIDKLSGAKLLDEKSAAQPGFRSVTVSATDRYVELRSYNERVRLYPEDKAASAGQSGGE